MAKSLVHIFICLLLEIVCIIQIASFEQKYSRYRMELLTQGKELMANAFSDSRAHVTIQHVGTTEPR